MSNSASCEEIPKVSGATQDIRHLVDRGFDVSARNRTYDDSEDRFWKIHFGIVFVKRGNRNVDLIVARLTKDLAERFHHADDLKRVPGDLQFFVQRVFIGKERAHKILSHYAH